MPVAGRSSFEDLMHRPRFAILLPIALTVILALAIAALAGPMYPIARGTSVEFWQASTGVNLGAPGIGALWGVIDGDTAYYAPPSMDSTWIYRVPKAEVMRDLPRVTAEFDKLAAGDPTRPAAAGYLHWKVRPASEKTANALILDTENSWRVPLSPSGRAEFAVQISRAHRWWLNAVFEWLYLSGIVWFVCWPVIRRSGTFARAVHLFLAPVLLLLPAWLGYCCILCNGPGISGGILYPYFSEPLARMGSMTPDMSKHFFWTLPKPLNGLTILPQWDIDTIVASRTEVSPPPGPVDAAFAGVGVVLLFLGFLAIQDQIRKRRQAPRGFEVILSTPRSAD